MPCCGPNPDTARPPTRCGARKTSGWIAVEGPSMLDIHDENDDLSASPSETHSHSTDGSRTTAATTTSSSSRPWRPILRAKFPSSRRRPVRSRRRCVRRRSLATTPACNVPSRRR
ncbi:hypothetical protein AAVH_09357 [Aphelenchoides avenae]|nr:hypothetical protein AAVH_09357 [Aphelenchus avenae]